MIICEIQMIRKLLRTSRNCSFLFSYLYIYFKLAHVNVSVGEMSFTQAAEGGVKGEGFLRGEENMSIRIRKDQPPRLFEVKIKKFYFYFAPRVSRLYHRTYFIRSTNRAYLDSAKASMLFRTSVFEACMNSCTV